jgi:hypothetical protein
MNEWQEIGITGAFIEELAGEERNIDSNYDEDLDEYAIDENNDYPGCS